MVIQHILFRRALEEEGIPIFDDHINHSLPANFNNKKQYPFVFPKSFIQDIKKLNSYRNIDYFFAGTLNCKGTHRDFLKTWDKPNSIILTPRENNFIHPNNDPTGYYGDNFFNVDYFSQLARTKFAFAPAGCSYEKEKDFFGWTYRFWEAVLAKAIPVTNEPHKILHQGYKYYSLEDEHIYREDWVEHNFNKLVKENFIWTED